MRSVICYGAGSNASRTVADLLNKGIVPVCFADASIRKQHTKITVNACSPPIELDILPLDKAIEKYPDYEICISTVPDIVSPVTDYLLQREIPLERIYHDGCEYRMGCPQVGTRFNYTSIISTCCHRSPVRINPTFDFAHDLELFRDECEAVIEKHRSGEQTSCDSCLQYKPGFYPKKPEIKLVSFDTGLKNSSCNVRCSYCFADHLLGHDSGVTLYESVKHLADIYHSSPLTLYLSSGEFTICPDAEKIIEIIEERNWSAKIFTNGRLYLDRIADMARNGNAPTLFLSVDAGTKETFIKVKNVDYWEALHANLKKYHESGAIIELKYILLEGINDNSRDIDGFYELARKFNCSVLFSNNLKKGGDPLSTKSLESAKYFIQKAKELGIDDVIPFPNFFNQKDLDILKGLN